MKKKIDLYKLFEDKRFLMVFALLMAVLLYIAVALTTNDTTTQTIPNVPIDLELQSANLTNLRLSVIEGNDHYVDVRINIPRTRVGQYNAQSPELATTARISSITEPGTYTLPVESAYDLGDLPFSIVSYSPRTIEVRVDRMQRKTFEIQRIVKGVAVREGYVMEGEAASPSTVTVSGPETEIAKISSAEVAVDLAEPLDQTIAPTVNIVLRDAAGAVIDPEEHYIKMDATQAQLVITVFKETGLPLEVGFRGVPRDFPLDSLEEIMTITPDYVRIAGREEVIERLTEIPLGYIDLKELYPGNSTFTFPLSGEEIAEEIVLRDNITSATVTFDDFNWEIETFNLSKIELLNEPINYNVRLLSERLDNVRLVGDAELLESLTADDIVAEVDLSDRELATGQRSYPVKISVPGRGLVWALDSYTTVIQIEEKE